MSYLTKNYIREQNEKFILAHTYKPFKQLINTPEGVYTATNSNVFLNNVNISVFKGRIVNIFHKDGMIVAYDTEGSIRIIMKKVIKRYEINAEVNKVELLGENLIVLDTKSTLYLFKLSETECILKKEFNNLISFAANENEIILCSMHELVYLDYEFVQLKTLKNKSKRKSKLFIKNSHLFLINKNKIKTINLENNLINKRIIHTKSIKKIEINDKNIYTLGKEGCIKELDYKLNILNKIIIKNIIDFDFTCDKVYALNNGEIYFIEKEKILKPTFNRFNIYEKMIKKYEYKNALLTALKNNETDILFSLITYIKEVDGINQSLYDHYYYDIKLLLKFFNDNWHSIHKEIIIEYVTVILLTYQRYLTEFMDEFKLLFNNLMTDIKIQKDILILLSYFESFD